MSKNMHDLAKKALKDPPSRKGDDKKDTEEDAKAAKELVGLKEDDTSLLPVPKNLTRNETVDWEEVT
ncbi:hypothetical protein Ptr902_11025 [Pyrenophora tritici-repentis]|nr:hypothetical protein Ptr902_11025 [Pyrenophora tritici-repentis]